VDVEVVDAIPVTTVARTLIDLASVCRPDAVEEALDAALRRGLVSLPRLRWRFEELGRMGRPGTKTMRALIDARGPAGPVPDSVFERRLLRVLRRAGLPEPSMHHEIRRAGRLMGVVDYAYPEVRLAIEADGRRWHSGRIRFQRDRVRLNRMTLLGWRVIHVTWEDLVERPGTVTEMITRALAEDPRASGR
jgi:very-short-patch-repair endonuclease